jgi:phosphatidylglycerol:prolipoprotein diacylglycerol transferase
MTQLTNLVQFPGLGLSFHLNRVAFSIGGVHIYWYGVCIAVGLCLALVFAFRHSIEFGVDPDGMVDVILIGVVLGIASARAYYVAMAPFKYQSIWEMIAIRDGGLAIYGGIIGGFLFGGLACKWRKVPVLPMFDLTAMGFLVGQCCGRWGNFFNQEAFGCNTTLPWGMYSEGTRSYLMGSTVTVQNGVTIDPNLPVHPTFLYESIWCLVGFVLLASHIKKRRFNGELFLLYIIWYGLGRYWIEGLRTDALMVTSTLRTSQLVALVSVATAVVLLVAGLQRFKGAQLMVPLQVSNLKKLDAAGTYFVVDELPASASHREFVQATAAMNRRLEEFDLDEAEKVEDNSDNGEAIEEGNVVAEPQQPAEAPEAPAPEDEAGE